MIPDAAFLFNAEFTRSDETCCWSGLGPGGQRETTVTPTVWVSLAGRTAAANDKIQLYSDVSTSRLRLWGRSFSDHITKFAALTLTGLRTAQRLSTRRMAARPGRGRSRL